MRDAISEVLIYNNKWFNYDKLSEELAELQEIIIKRRLKKDEWKPSIQRVTEEVGDVILRLKILCRMEGIQQAVNERVQEKSMKLLKHIDNKQFKGEV